MPAERFQQHTTVHKTHTCDAAAVRTPHGSKACISVDQQRLCIVGKLTFGWKALSNLHVGDQVPENHSKCLLMAWLWRCLARGEQTDKDQQIQPGLAHPRQTTQDSPEPCMRLGTNGFLLNRLLDGWPDVRERGAPFLDSELTETFIHVVRINRQIQSSITCLP